MKPSREFLPDGRAGWSRRACPASLTQRAPSAWSGSQPRYGPVCCESLSRKTWSFFHAAGGHRVSPSEEARLPPGLHTGPWQKAQVEDEGVAVELRVRWATRFGGDLGVGGSCDGEHRHPQLPGQMHLRAIDRRPARRPPNAPLQLAKRHSHGHQVRPLDCSPLLGGDEGEQCRYRLDERVRVTQPRRGVGGSSPCQTTKTRSSMGTSEL